MRRPRRCQGSGDDPIDDGLWLWGWSWRRRGPASAGSIPWGSSSFQRFGALGGQLGVSTPSCFAYSAFNRCQPPNFIASPPSDAADGSSAEKVIQNIETNVPPGSTH